MRVLSTRIHGMIDYAFGILLIVAPYVLGFANGGAAQYLPQALGAAIVMMSLVTDYELSLARLIPMPAHLGVDMLGGVLLAASPWLFGFSDRVYWPHLILGIIEIGTAAMTETRSGAGDLTARAA
jgi:hypothetical protein